MTEIEQLAEKCLRNLAYLEPYVYHRALTGSIYIKFRDSSMGSLRISDHPGRKKYRYKWNLHIELKEDFKEVMQGKVKRFFYRSDNLDRMLSHMHNYAAAIERRRVQDAQAEQEYLSPFAHLMEADQ